jgi:hypothetical protein
VPPTQLIFFAANLIVDRLSSSMAFSSIGNSPTSLLANAGMMGSAHDGFEDARGPSFLLTGTPF